ncbi:MAG: translation initiation factor IF-3 [Actinobacteria bacterium]|nr:translation initiation factor IF-3 [Actinomycetota bacterium]
MNDRIRAREVRLIAEDGTQLGIRPLPEALTMAREQSLDLVEVADKADPPVCRIMNYGNYEYQAAKRARESRRKSSTTVLKEMKYRPKIGSGDFDTKTKKVEKFLSEGHKVKVTIMFRGREVYHPELGRKILDHVAEVVSHLGRVEVMPKGVEGRNMTMVLAPDKKAQAHHASTSKKSGSSNTDGSRRNRSLAPSDNGAGTPTDGVTAGRPVEAPVEERAGQPAEAATDTPTER